MTTTNKKSDTPATIERHFDVAIAAVEKHLPAGTRTYDLGGVSFTRDQLLSYLQAVAAPYKLATSLRSQLKATVRVRDAGAAVTRQVLKELRALVMSVLGSQGTALEDFGYAAPRPRTPLTAEQAHARAVKAALTRKARGTMGPKQRAAIAPFAPARVVFTATIVPGTAGTETAPPAPPPARPHAEEPPPKASPPPTAAPSSGVPAAAPPTAGVAVPALPAETAPSTMPKAADTLPAVPASATTPASTLSPASPIPPGPAVTMPVPEPPAPTTTPGVEPPLRDPESDPENGIRDAPST